MWTLGIDVGGTQVKLAVVNDHASICYRRSVATQTGVDSLIRDLCKHIDQALAEASSRGIDVSAIGIGVPGQVHCNRILGGINNFPELLGVSLDEKLATFDLPIKVENDTYLMGVAESRFGTAKDSANVVFLTVGTGIGAALKLRGRFYRGAHGRASEIGHMILAYGGATCTCGNRGCFEALASTSALIDRYTQLSHAEAASPRESPTGYELVGLYLDGDSAAVEALQLHFDYLAAGIASVINIFDPQQVVLGGGITECGDFYMSEVRRRVEKGIFEGSTKDTSIDSASLGTWAGCIGAACIFSAAAAPVEEFEKIAEPSL